MNTTDQTYDALAAELVRRSLTDAEIRRLVQQLLDAGEPEAVIARRSGLSRTTVRRHNGKG